LYNSCVAFRLRISSDVGVLLQSEKSQKTGTVSNDAKELSL
jgi:hypothetical protein